MGFGPPPCWACPLPTWSIGRQVMLAFVYEYMGWLRALKVYLFSHIN